MKILHTLHNTMSVKENAYGGTETFTYLLDRELTKKGICSNVLARGDSVLYNDPEQKRVIKLLGAFIDEEYFRNNFFKMQLLNVNQVITELETIQKGDYTIIHSQTSDTMRFGNHFKTPIITTIHFPVDWYWNKQEFGEFNFGNNHFVCVSKYQKEKYVQAGYPIEKIIYNGVNIDDFEFNIHKKNYVLLLGRVSEQKGTHLAINAARKVNENIVIAGEIFNEETYYRQIIKPSIDIDISKSENRLKILEDIVENEKGKVIYFGGAYNVDKISLYQNAKVALMTSIIPESCPLVPMEAMSTGTPVVGFNIGSISEIIAHKRTGYVVELANTNKLADAIIKSENIDPRTCRKHVVDNFNFNRVVEEYINLYRLWG